MSAEDYYKTLGVSKNASNEEIKTAYRRLAFEYHPDRNNSVYAKERIKDINLAYDTLSDPEKRAVYDRGPGFTTGPARNSGTYWKKEYTWTWGGQGTSRRSGSDRARKGYSNTSGTSKTDPWPGSGAEPDRGKSSSVWETVDMILRLLGALAIFWLILRRPMLIVLLVIAAAFLLAVWAFLKDLMQISGKK